MGIETRTFEIPKANSKTFEKIDFDCGCSFNFAKDKNHLYIDGYIYNNVDARSFKFGGKLYFQRQSFSLFLWIL